MQFREFDIWKFESWQPKRLGLSVKYATTPRVRTPQISLSQEFSGFARRTRDFAVAVSAPHFPISVFVAPMNQRLI